MPSHRRVSVGILEDHCLIRESLESALAGAGHEVAGTTGDLRELLSLLGERCPDVAIIGVPLERHSGEPASDGLTVLEEVTMHHPQVRSLVLSPDRSPERLEEYARGGALGVLHKAAASSIDVVFAVEAVARGERLLRGAAARDLEPGASRSRTLPAKLTPRELEVLSRVAAGEDNLKIATLLGITERTVKAHVGALYQKLGMENRVQLALLARELGVVFDGGNRSRGRDTANRSP